MRQADQLTSELATERSNSQKIDTERSMLDRQNKELHAKLAEAEAQLKSRTKAAMQALESKIANLEEQLDAEARLVQSVFIFGLSASPFVQRQRIITVTG